MMASGMLANDGEWNVGEMTSGMLAMRMMASGMLQMMASGMLANDGEWNVGE